MKDSANSFLDQILIFLASNNLVLGYVLITVSILICFFISMKITAGSKPTKEDFRRLANLHNFKLTKNREGNTLFRQRPKF